MDNSLDTKYLQILLNRIEISKAYKPKFGQSSQGISLHEFRALYGADSFYTWFGLDNPMMYVAHKAAGGITSVYRQIGIGCEELFRQIIQDNLELTAEQVSWSYEVKASSNRIRTLTLDGRIEPSNVIDLDRRTKIMSWMEKAAHQLQLEPRVAQAMRGIVMEIRQGYKSKDSKR